jgi:cell division protein FtsB
VASEERHNEQVRKLQAEKQDAATQNETLRKTVARLETEKTTLNDQVESSDVLNQQIRDLEARM